MPIFEKKINKQFWIYKLFHGWLWNIWKWRGLNFKIITCTFGLLNLLSPEITGNVETHSSNRIYCKCRKPKFKCDKVNNKLFSNNNKIGVSSIVIFGSAYLCEQLISIINGTWGMTLKIKKSNDRVALRTTYKPRIWQPYRNTQQKVSH